MSPPSVVKVGRIRSGYRIRVEGRGTLRESPAVHEFAGHALGDGARTLVVDLSACDYLDSTFLGCLVDLHKHHGSGEPPRLLIAASPAVRRQAFAANHLEPLFHHVDECPEVIGEDRVIPPLALEATRPGLAHPGVPPAARRGRGTEPVGVRRGRRGAGSGAGREPLRSSLTGSLLSVSIEGGRRGIRVRVAPPSSLAPRVRPGFSTFRRVREDSASPDRPATGGYRAGPGGSRGFTK